VFSHFTWAIAFLWVLLNLSWNDFMAMEGGGGGCRWSRGQVISVHLNLPGLRHGEDFSIIASTNWSSSQYVPLRKGVANAAAWNGRLDRHTGLYGGEFVFSNREEWYDTPPRISAPSHTTE
jgi:hypothetical protein